MTYLFCKKIIENQAYESKEDMLIKLGVFLLNDRITQDQYNELASMLNEQG